MAINDIEYQILPLVDAINSTGMFQTFSSCGGHFTKIGKNDIYADFGCAEVKEYPNVKFRAARGISNDDADNFLTRLSGVAKDIFFDPKCGVILFAVGKKYLPTNLGGPYYILEFRPFPRCQDVRKAVDDAFFCVAQIIRAGINRNFPGVCQANGNLKIVSSPSGSILAPATGFIPVGLAESIKEIY